MKFDYDANLALAESAGRHSRKLVAQRRYPPVCRTEFIFWLAMTVGFAMVAR